MFNRISFLLSARRFWPVSLLLSSIALVSLVEMIALSRTGVALAQPVEKMETPSEGVPSNASRKRRILRRRSRRPAGSQSQLPAPPRRLPPNRVQPGGGLSSEASSCGAEMPLTALVPVENPVFTTSATPSFLFYFPDGSEAVDYAELTVLTADEKEQIYTAQFSPSGPGISSVSIPAVAEQGLAVGEAYHWYLNVHCKGTSTVLAVDGWVQRVASEDAVEGVVETELPLVWYDAIAAAGEQILTDADSRRVKQWEDWLIAAGLVELVDVPVLGEVEE